MIVIDYSDTRPIYEQIVEKLKNYILKGVLPPDSQLMSVRAMAMELSINPNTIQRAYAELEREGFIYTIKGRGNFVRYDAALLDRRKSELVDRMEAVLKEADELGISKEELVEILEKRLQQEHGEEQHD
ncbi:MAG: GntR family transcriptional regulator [Lachnospiraceae bacterium]|nr:GntR family transcriptional regulator [Lachnospiraceae bacterium]